MTQFLKGFPDAYEGWEPLLAIARKGDEFLDEFLPEEEPKIESPFQLGALLLTAAYWEHVDKTHLEEADWPAKPGSRHRAVELGRKVFLPPDYHCPSNKKMLERCVSSLPENESWTLSVWLECGLKALSLKSRPALGAKTLSILTALAKNFEIYGEKSPDKPDSTRIKIRRRRPKQEALQDPSDSKSKPLGPSAMGSGASQSAEPKELAE